jgi:hypothetical protein
MVYKNVFDPYGQRRIAGIENGDWVSCSNGIASLEGRENGMSPYGSQATGTWPCWPHQRLVDVETGAVYLPKG